MKNLIKLTVSFCVGLSFLSGCGGGTTVADSELDSGYFVDSIVTGLEYRRSTGENGITDENGLFLYKRGERVEFSLGKLSLGSAVPEVDGLVTPDNLGVTEDVKIRILRLLQSLDIDSNTSNGITISSKVIDALSALPQTVDISNLQNDEDILALDDNLTQDANILDYYMDRDFDGILDVDESEALAHYTQSLNEWREGHRIVNGYAGYEDFNRSVLDLVLYPLSSLTDEQKYSLAHMWNEEKLAKDIYLSLYDVFPINQLINIAVRGEDRHESMIEDLVSRYDINITNLSDYKESYSEEELRAFGRGEFGIEAIQSLYDTLYDIGSVSQEDALKVGCMVEVTDINDLDNYISMANDANLTDFVVTFEDLRSGSYSHYWAFDKGLKNMGVDEGCCSIGEINGINYCHNEYPEGY